MSASTLCNAGQHTRGSKYREDVGRLVIWLHDFGRYIEYRAQRRARTKAATQAVPELNGLTSATLHDLRVRLWDGEAGRCGCQPA